MDEKVYHVSGEVGHWDEFYQYSDERVDEKTLRVRVANVTRARDVHLSNAEYYRRQAEKFDALAGKYDSHLENLRRVAQERGVTLD